MTYGSSATYGSGTGSASFSRLTGSGHSGSLHAHAQSAASGQHVTSVIADATDNISGTTTVSAESLIGGAIPTFITSAQAVAWIDGAPTNAGAVLSANFDSTAIAKFGANPIYLGVSELGGGVAAGGSGPQTSTSTVDLKVAVNATDVTKDLIVGLFDGTSVGSGATSVSLDITANGHDVLDKTFNSAAAAVAYFKNDVVDLGKISGFASSGGSLDVVATLKVTAAAGSGFYGGLLITDGAPVITG